MQNHSKVSVRPRALSREELRIFEKESGATRQNAPAKTQIFGQGQAADAISYIIKGKVQITVVSKQGRGGMVGLVSEGGFVGEACLTGQPFHLDTATAFTDCIMLQISVKRMLAVLKKNAVISGFFTYFLLQHSMDVQAELVDHLFNSSEKRLARILLMLANFGNGGKLESIPHITQELLAERVGTTRARISFFMNKFRRLGLIEYNGKIKVHSGLLNVILHDSRITEKS